MLLLIERIERIPLGNTKKSYHAGLIELRKWNRYFEGTPAALQESLCFMQKQFHKIAPNSEAGTSNLTTVIQSIGEIFATSIGTYNMELRETWDIKAHIGSAIVDTLCRLDYIELEREGQGPYQIIATDKWINLKTVIIPGSTQVFRGLSKTKPLNLTSSTLPNGKPLVKKQYSLDFEGIKDSVHVQGMNKIIQTPWRINKRIFDIVSAHTWNNSIPDIPAEGNKHKVEKLYQKLKTNPELINEYNKESLLWTRKREALKIRSNILERKIAIAKAGNLLNTSSFYNLMDTDYRGRLYYLEAYIHYQGNDLAKGLLEFAYGKELTPSGLRWLKIHTACCFNADSSFNLKVDKLSLEERANWSDEHMEFIRTTSKEGTIHTSAEKPIMFLAACIELAEATEALDNGEIYISHLPVPVDGSSNAAQHAAAINKDIETAEQVGLVPSERPVDLYTNVGDMTVGMAQDFFDEFPLTPGEIRKNISKRSTMSRSYSAGHKSISKGMYSDCYKNGITTKYDITPLDCDQISKVVVKAIDKVCPANARLRTYLGKLVLFEIGDWCKELKAIVQGNGAKVITWTSPSGFPVTSRLNFQHTIAVRVSIFGKRIKIRGKWDTDVPKISKHISAIAANVVHSHDAAHMTAVAAEWDGCFGAVHDSFATHASDVDDLVALTKEKFISMYSSDNYYEDITDNILSDQSGFDSELPETGDYDIEQVRTSDFFFC